MPGSGTVTLTFGTLSTPNLSPTATVTGQSGIAGSSLVEAWIMPATTADHSVDEHIVESVRVVAGPPSAGSGFTVFGVVPSGGGTVYGAFNVAWAWV